MTNTILKELLKLSAERVGYQYATGNHASSFPDTHDMKAFIAGANSRDEIILQLCEALERTKEELVSEYGIETYEINFPFISRILASVYASLEGEK